MSVDKMPLDEMTVDEMSEDKMTCTNEIEPPGEIKTIEVKHFCYSEVFKVHADIYFYFNFGLVATGAENFDTFLLLKPFLTKNKTLLGYHAVSIEHRPIFITVVLFQLTLDI